MEPDADAPMRTLLEVMVRLRDPVLGCPWDQAQDFASIAPYTVEEAHEVAAEIADGPDPARLKDELGDLLLQVVYHARIAEERGWFNFGQVAAGITAKMVRRHPHVFGGVEAEGWEAAKARERASRAEHGVLAGLATGLPSLSHAAKLTARAARIGFDWPDAAAVLDKLEEEAQELRAELATADPARLADEVGDLLFVMANLARKLRLDPETCLREASAKFTRRFQAVEASLAEQGLSPSDVGLDAMEDAWKQAKLAGL